MKMRRNDAPRGPTLVDLKDILGIEYDRLKALAQLLRVAQDGVDAEVLNGLGVLLSDICRRIEPLLA